MITNPGTGFEDVTDMSESATVMQDDLIGIKAKLEAAPPLPPVNPTKSPL